MATIKDSLKAIGHSALRDEAWAKKQLTVLHHQDKWIDQSTEVIDPEEHGGVEQLIGFFKQGNRANGGRRRVHRVGFELVVEPDYSWDAARGTTVAEGIAAEIQTRVGRHMFDWQDIMFLIPGLGIDGAKDLTESLLLRNLVIRDSKDPQSLRFQLT